MKFTYVTGDKPVPGYTIRRGLGRGGFGEVYLAVSQRGKEVALKLVQRHLDVELRGVGQCLNLKHPHLLVVYDILQVENDDYWVVMEFVAGESLADVLDRHPHGLPEREALFWLRGICAGVAYLHDHGIAHRDLKPSNLFLEKGVVKIGDYGLSKFISASQRSGHTEGVGTVYYMAPEVSHGRYGKEVDQYALGVILYQMLTGRLPFDGESPGEILMKHLVSQPDLTGLPEPYRPVVTRLLDKDPQRRFPSVGEALNHLLDHVPAAAQAGPGPAPTQSYPGPGPGESAAEEAAAEGPRDDPPWSGRTVAAFLAMFGRKAGASCDQPGPEQPEGADLDRASLIQFLIENGITVAEEIAQVFQTLGEGPEHDWLARARAVRILAEKGKEASEIIALLKALRKRPGQDLSPKLQALQVLLDHGVEDGDDISRVLRALDDSSGKELSGHVTALRVLLENGVEGGEDIVRVLEALREHPAFDLSGKLTVLRLLVENGIDSADIARVLHALGKYPGQDQSAKIRAVQVLVEHGMCDSADIARVLAALARCPGPNLAGTVRAVESMVENGMGSEDIARVLRVLGECPEHDLASKVQAVRSMASEGMEVEDIERSIRGH